MSKSIDFDVDDYLDSLTLEELRSYAKIGVSFSIQAFSLCVRSLTKVFVNKNIVNPSAPEQH